MTESESYAAAARLAGCPEDQMRNCNQAGALLQPKQLDASAAARLCDQPNGPVAVGYGGARGGGKSHWLLTQMGVDDCQRRPGLKCLLLRKVGKSNLENFEDLRRRLFHRLPHEFNTSRGILTFANGSRIIAGHFQNEKDIDAYLGLEYDVIGVEEATTLTARKYQDISTCCRTSKPDWRPRIYSTTNPGGVGHAWYRTKFILQHLEHQRSITISRQPSENPVGAVEIPGSTAAPAVVRCALAPNPSVGAGQVRHERRSGCETTPDIISLSSIPNGGEGRGRGGAPVHGERGCLHHLWDGRSQTIFIPARVDDNAFNNPDYRKVLENLGGWQRRAWLDGDWDIAAGQFFTTFRREVHVIDDFDDTRAREWFAAFDYGFTHYTVALLGCRDGDGNTFIVDEHAERQWLPSRHAAAIKAMVARHRTTGGQRIWVSNSGVIPTRPLELRDLRRIVAGPDVFSRQSDGTTIAAQYSREGITLRCANPDRVNGWAEILRGLGDGGTGSTAPGGVRPTLFFHKRCGRLIETLSALQHDPNRPEDVLKVDADEDGIGGDDCADALRYLVATKPREIVVRKLRGF